MFRGKVYGQSQIAVCPFCRSTAMTKNSQGIPVCHKHSSARMPDLKCVCGKWLDQRESKFGVFYTCIDCGTVSFSRMLEINGDRIRQGALEKKPEPKGMSSPGRFTIRERVQEKLRKGEPLTPEELDFL